MELLFFSVFFALLDWKNLFAYGQEHGHMKLPETHKD
jgi:hypothetical protein